ncbi:MAG: response regulator, partial [Planctomycetaceae bacterium]
MRLGDGMDGLTTLDQIKQIAPQVHVIVASGYSTTQRVRQAVKLGAGFLKKPYHLERLEQALRQYSDHTTPPV